MDALIWVLDSEVPLQTDKLCNDLRVKIGAVDLDLENAPTILTHLGCSFERIEVMASSSTVRLVHFTLREWLNSKSTCPLSCSGCISIKVCGL